MGRFDALTQLGKKPLKPAPPPVVTALFWAREEGLCIKKHLTTQLYKVTLVWYAASKARNQRSWNTMCWEISQWIVNSDSASTVGNLWCLTLLSVPTVARR